MPYACSFPSALRRVPLVMLISLACALALWADGALAQSAGDAYRTCRDSHHATAPSDAQRQAWVQAQRASPFGRTQAPPWLQQQQAAMQRCLRDEGALLAARRAPGALPHADGAAPAKKAV